MSQVITPSVTTNIKNRLKQKVEALASVDQVFGHEETNPTGWPAVCITANDLEGEFASNAENSRDFGFTLLIMFPMSPDYTDTPEGADKEEYAEQVVATVIDEIINTMDTDYELAGSDATVLFVKASDCSWGTVNAEIGVTKAAQIKLRIYTELTVS